MPKFGSVREMMAQMPSLVSPEAMAGMNAVLQLDLAGDGGGQWYLTIANQTMRVDEGLAATPNMTLTMTAADYLSMSNGNTNPTNLFMQGKIKIKGDMQLAMKLQALFK
jgi:putative sterol carrier protein